MMKQFRFITAVFITATLFIQCSSRGKLMQLAAAAEQREEYDDAAKYYYNVVLQQPKNDKAKAGLKSSGQKILTTKFASFSKLVIANRIKESIEQYQFAEQFFANAQRVGVELDWPVEYREVYDDVCAEYASQVFDEALVLMNQKKYDQAETKFAQIAQLDTSYRGISVLRIHTVYDALHKKASQLMQASRFKEAYSVWNKLLALDPQYKDAAAMSELAKSKATLKLGIFPVRTNTPVDMSTFERTMDVQVSKNNTAYLQLWGPNTMRDKLTTRGWQDISTTTQVIEAAKNTTLSYVVWIELLNSVDTAYEIKSKPTDAYEAVSDQILNPYTGTYTYITKFKKILLNDSHKGIELSYRFRVTLIRTQDSTVLFTDELALERTDKIHKINYTGKPENIYPELPKGNYLPQVSNEWRERFATTQRELLDKSVLQTEIENELAKKISFIINKHIK